MKIPKRNDGRINGQKVNKHTESGNVKDVLAV